VIDKDLTSKEALDALEEELHAWGSVISRDQKAADTIQALRERVQKLEAQQIRYKQACEIYRAGMKEARTVTRECGCRRVWRDMTDSGYVCEKMGNRIMDFRCTIKGGEDE
jgi:hypothetical protein